jgi:hypothetical protein
VKTLLTPGWGSLYQYPEREKGILTKGFSKVNIEKTFINTVYVVS